MPRKLDTEEAREKKRAYEREWRRKRYQEDPEYRQRKRSQDNAWRDRLREEVRQYKLEQGCSQCGYSKCSRALQFHHANGVKEFEIARDTGMGREKMWQEIDKCELLCSNCHAERHCLKGCL